MGERQELTRESKEHNQLRSQDCILVENFFGRWKGLFGVCKGRYQGNLKDLSQIAPTTVVMQNWCIQRRRLRRRDDGMEEESGENSDESVAVAIELDTTRSSDDDEKNLQNENRYHRT
jgi:hypothetical protein